MWCPGRALLPRSQWQSLVHQGAIKVRLLISHLLHLGLTTVSTLPHAQGGFLPSFIWSKVPILHQNPAMPRVSLAESKLSWPAGAEPPRAATQEARGSALLPAHRRRPGR